MKTFIFIRYIYTVMFITIINLVVSIISFFYVLLNGDPFTYLVIFSFWIGLSLISLVSLYKWYNNFQSRDLLMSQLPNIAEDFGEGHSTRDIQEIYLSAETQELVDLLLPVRSLVNNIISMIFSFKLEQDTLEALLEAMADGVLLVDAEGQILRMNSAASQLLHIDSDQLKSNQSFMGLVFDHELANLVHLALENNSIAQDEIELLRPNKIMDAIVTPIQNSTNREVVITLHDLTEIRRINTTRKEFVNNVSHELKTPLTAVKAMVETMENGVLPKSRQKEYFTKINDEIDRMTTIVTELLKLSGIERDNYQESFDTVDINKLVSQVSDNYKDILEKKLILLELDLFPSPLVINCNQYHITEVITNLIDNATKFTPENGVITLATKSSDDFVIVQCKDTGIGISEEDMPHVFERFYKVDKSRSATGTGLGLSIAKHILENHQGNIVVNSNLNDGSEFIITLPLDKTNITP